MSDPTHDRKRPTLVFLPAMLCNDDLYRPQIEGLRDLVEPMTLTVAEETMADAAAEVLRAAPEHFLLAGTSCSPEPPMEGVLLWKSSRLHLRACSGYGSWAAIPGLTPIPRPHAGETIACRTGNSTVSSMSWPVRSRTSAVPTPSAQRAAFVAWPARQVPPCSCDRTRLSSVGETAAPIWPGSSVRRFSSGAGKIDSPPLGTAQRWAVSFPTRAWSSSTRAAICRPWSNREPPSLWPGTGLAVSNTSEHGQWISRRARAADHPQRRHQQHELIALLFDAGLRQRLEQRVVDEGHAVREDHRVDRPRDVVADRQVVEHVPSEHAHVVVAQERQAGYVEPGTLLLRRIERTTVRALRILRLPRLPSGVDADGVARLELDPPLGEDVVELPAVHGCVVRHARRAAMARDIEHDGAGHDALGPVLDRPEPGALERDLLLRIAPVPHRVVVPGVAERVDVGRRDAVVVDAVVVRGEAALAPRMRAHEMVSRQRVVGAGIFRKRPAQRDATPGAHELGCRRALRRCDEVDGAELIVLAPAAPVAPLPDPALHFLLCR